MCGRQLLRAAVIVLIAGGGVLSASRPAAACIYRLDHNFSPFPPCEFDDMPAHDRVRQLNMRLATKLALIVGKIRMVKREVTAWKGAYESVQRWDEHLQRLWGDATANPIPSFVAEWNRNGFGQIVRISPDGSLKWVDPVRLGEEAIERYKAGAALLYEELRWKAEGEPERLEGDLRRVGTQVGRQIDQLLDYRQHTTQIRDSLVNQGLRHATRYGGVAEAAGLSEAKLSTLTAALSMLQGTAFEAEARAVQGRLRALAGAAAKQESLLDAQSRVSSLWGW